MARTTTPRKCWHFWRDRHVVYGPDGTKLHCQKCCDKDISIDGRIAVQKYRPPGHYGG